jgi:hypothetical protein
MEFYNYAPTSFANIWLKNNDNLHNYELRDNDNYRIPNPRMEFFKKIPLYLLPHEWNNLGGLTFQINKNLFRNLLKEKLLNEIQI